MVGLSLAWTAAFALLGLVVLRMPRPGHRPGPPHICTSAAIGHQWFPAFVSSPGSDSEGVREPADEAAWAGLSAREIRFELTGHLPESPENGQSRPRHSLMSSLIHPRYTSVDRRVSPAAERPERPPWPVLHGDP
jgi:hypothetical protein